MESERTDSESTRMETPHEDNVVVEDLAIMNMSSPEQVKKDLIGATKYLHWVREKEAPIQKLVMKKCLFKKRLLYKRNTVLIWMIPVTRITCLVMMRAVEGMRR